MKTSHIISTRKAETVILSYENRKYIWLKKNSTVYPFDDDIYLVWISVYLVLLINKEQMIHKCLFRVERISYKQEFKRRAMFMYILIIVKHIEKNLCCSSSTTEQNNLSSERKKKKMPLGLATVTFWCHFSCSLYNALWMY